MTTILVVDDTPEQITALAVELTSEGFEVVTAEGAVSGIAAARREWPDCILMDYRMPEIDGVEAIRRLKSDADLADIPVIMMSADQEHPAVVGGLEAGAIDFIGKPFNMPIAIARIRAAVRAKVALEEQRRLRQEAESAAEMRATFLASMGHEIRTPLNGIVGMSQMLSDTELDPLQYDYLGTINNSGQMLLHLINDLLDLAKLEAGKVELEIIDTDLRTLVEDTLALFTGRAAERDVGLYGIVRENVPEVMQLDPTRIQQIISNLVSNAVKFTERGYVAIEANIEKNPVTGRPALSIAVQDTGIGMTSEQAEKIFEPFVQAEASVKRKYGGTGLGMSICRELIEVMEGQIEIRSEPGIGTCFNVLVPLTTVGRAPNRGTHSGQVLVLEGIEDSYRSLATKLELFGYKVTLCRTTRAAERVIAERGGDLTAAFVSLDDGSLDPGRISASLEEVGAQVVLTGSPKLRTQLQGMGGDLANFLAHPYRSTQVGLMLGHDRSEAVPTTRSMDTVANRTVLVAEDNTVNQKVIALMLEKLGLVLTMVANGQEAVDACADQHFDFLLLDCEMPVLDGYGAAQGIRAAEAERGGHRQTIIALSAGADEQACLDAGMDMVLSKPIKRDALHAALLRALLAQ